MIATKWPGYNTPTRTLRCITAVHGFKFARFEYTDSNVQKTSFPFGCPYKRCAQPLDSIDVCFDPPCHYMTGLVGANIQIIFQFTTIIDEKKIKMLLTSTNFQTKPAEKSRKVWLTSKKSPCKGVTNIDLNLQYGQ